MTRQQWIQLLLVVVFFGFSALKVVFGKLQQQAARRKIEIELERRRLEALRTGKPVEEIPVAGPPRRIGPTPEQLQELARRRAAQLEELRRVQAAQRKRGAIPGAGPVGDVIVVVPGSTGPTVPGTRSPARSQGKRSGQGERAQRPGRPPTPRRDRPVERPTQPTLEAPRAASKPVQREVRPTPQPIEIRQAFGVPVFAKRMSAQDLRRAFIAAEILNKPVAERPPTEAL